MLTSFQGLLMPFTRAANANYYHFLMNSWILFLEVSNAQSIYSVIKEQCHCTIMEQHAPIRRYIM